MNIADKMEREARLKGNLAEWMLAHGTVKSDRSRSNEYVGVRIAEVCWRGQDYCITWVDGMACSIEREWPCHKLHNFPRRYLCGICSEMT